MDDIVRQAMAKWPTVPACYGWLGLSARGVWHMRDDQAQACGTFQSGTRAAKGSPLAHEKLIKFIERNYLSDRQGRWYFQNGPQRVFVEMEVSPWIWRVDSDGTVSAHDGQSVTWHQCLVDEAGWLYLETSLGFGLVHSMDVERAAQFMQTQQWQAKPVQRKELPQRYGYVLSPEQDRLQGPLASGDPLRAKS